MRRFATLVIVVTLAAVVSAGPIRRPPVATPVSPIYPTAVEPESLETMTLSPMIEITKKCPQLRYLGREATFEITVTNKGNAAAQNVTVTDAIAGGVEIVSIENNGTLLAAGLIAGEALVGLVFAGIAFYSVDLLAAMKVFESPSFIPSLLVFLIVGLVLVMIPLRNAGKADEPAPPSAVS